MDTYQMGLVIRALMFLAMIFVLTIGGVFLARRDKRSAARSVSDAVTDSRQPAVLEESLHFPDSLHFSANRETLEANDYELSAPRLERRAA